MAWPDVVLGGGGIKQADRGLFTRDWSMLQTVPFRCSWGVRPRAGTAAGACAVDRRTADRRLHGEVGSSVMQGGSSTGLKLETW